LLQSTNNHLLITNKHIKQRYYPRCSTLNGIAIATDTLLSVTTLLSVAVSV